MSATKQFLQVEQVKNGVVIQKSGGLCSVLLVSSINFELKADDEKQAIISAYQSFLNSLDYPIQILITSRQINLDDYLVDLENHYEKQANELLKLQIGEYLNFINSLIEVSNVISKNFYVVIPYSPGANTKSFFSRGKSSSSYSEKQLEEYRNQLWQRVKQVRVGLLGLGLHAEALNTRELIELLYNFYNPARKAKRIGALYKEPAG